MKPQIREVFDGLPFDTEDKNLIDIELTDAFVVIHFDEEVAFGLEECLDECEVIYNREEFLQFQNELRVELDALDKELEEMSASKRTPAQSQAFASIDAWISRLDSQINNVDLEEDNVLDTFENLSREIDTVEMEIESVSWERGDRLPYDLRERLTVVRKRIKNKLDEIGYEGPEFL